MKHPLKNRKDGSEKKFTHFSAESHCHPITLNKINGKHHYNNYHRKINT